MKRLFECRRYDEDSKDNGGDWQGALLIFADTEDSAITIFNRVEDSDCFGVEPQGPASIIEITDFNGVIYDDQTR